MLGEMCNFSLASPSFTPLKRERERERERPGWRDSCAGLKENLEAYWKATGWIRMHVWLAVQCLHEHKWASSCHGNFTSSFFIYSAIEWAVAPQERVITCNDWGWESYKHEEKPIICQNLGIIMCITSRTLPQNILVMVLERLLGGDLTF